MVKKSYNPFKMWGSYVGALIISFILLMFDNGFKNCLVNSSFDYLKCSGSNFLFIFLYLIIGFLIGYGIHSIVRAVRS